MKPLRVLLVHRDQWYRWQRVDGQFAYDVPEFRVAHRTVPKWFSLDLREYGDYDLVWWDDGKYRGGPRWFSPPPGPERKTPVVYYCLYPTLNDSIYQSRRSRIAHNCDMVLLDHDNPARWADLGIPVRRCAYSVDETRYRDQGLERDVDVGFFCVWKYSPERAALSEWLAGYCQKRGWRYVTNFGELRQDYPVLLARSKVVVHLNRTPNTRPPRIFDAAACGTAIVASRMPAVDGECWEDGVTYAAFDRPTATYHDEEHSSVAPYTDADCQQIADALDHLIAGGHWQQIGERARAYVLREHTWRVRAQQLHQTLKETLRL